MFVFPLLTYYVLSNFISPHFFTNKDTQLAVSGILSVFTVVGIMIFYAIIVINDPDNFKHE